MMNLINDPKSWKQSLKKLDSGLKDFGVTGSGYPLENSRDLNLRLKHKVVQHHPQTTTSTAESWN